MEELVYLNGALLPPEQAKVSVFDHGFLYGFALFETMRAYHGKIFLLDIDEGSIHEILSISPDIVGELSISHDNRWIYFNRSSTEADIWMLTLEDERE